MSSTASHPGVQRPGGSGEAAGAERSPWETTAAALKSARRKASGAALTDRRAELERALGAEGYDDLRRRWREMGRDVVAAIRADEYERVEVVPFDVTVGRVPDR